MNGYGVKVQGLKTASSQKGQKEELSELYKGLTIKGSDWPIEFWDMVQTTKVSFIV